MTTYDTGNPVPSGDARDRFDNTQTLDELVNSEASTTTSRTGKILQTWKSLVSMFMTFMQNFGYEAAHLTYVDGSPLTVARPTQLIDRAGSVYKVKQPATFPVTLTGSWVTDNPKLVDVGDSPLRQQLAGSGGAAMIGDGTMTVASQLQPLRTVEYYGAVGNGVTDDKAAFLAMFAATGGIIRMQDKSYNVNGLTLNGAYVAIRGNTKPAYNGDFTRLVSGSIMVGNVNIRSPFVDVIGIGIDAGSARGISAADGFVINSPVGGSGVKVRCRDNIVLGTNETSDSHAILIQGFNDHDVEGNDTALHQFGVVVKGRNGFVRATTGYRIRTAVVYPKSDVPSVGGDVADASVNNLIVDGVISRANPTNTTCNAVYVHASTLSLSNVTVTNVESTHGNAALRIAGGSDTSIVPSGVTYSNIKSERAVRTVELFGYNYDTIGSNIRAVNPSSGEAVSTSGNSYNYYTVGINTLISDPAITATSAASFNGVGGFDNFTVRNPYRQMSIAINLANCKAGSTSGDVKIAGAGAMTLVNGWGNPGGALAPTTRVGSSNLIGCQGRVLRDAGTSSNTIATFAFPQSYEREFSCAALKTDSTHITVPVYLSGTSLIVQYDRSLLTWIDLSGVLFLA